MKRDCHLPVIVAVVLTYVAALAGSLQGASVVLPLKVVGKMVVLQVGVEGKGPYRFLLDTGSETSLIDSGLAEKLGSTATHRIQLATMAGEKVVRASRATLELGPISASQADLLWMDDAAVGLRVKADGVIGQNVLKDFNYMIDYDRLTLTLTPVAEGFQSMRGNEIPCRMVASRCEITVPLGVFGRAPVPAAALLLDSGADCLTLVRKKAVEFQALLGPGALAGGRIMTHAGLTGGVVSGIVPQLMVAGRMLMQAHVALMHGAGTEDGNRTSDGLLPTSLFQRVYFNNTAGTVLLNPTVK